MAYYPKKRLWIELKKKKKKKRKKGHDILFYAAVCRECGKTIIVQ
jgi:predicted Zn-ribbon and HTH transcriptional regulator